MSPNILAEGNAEARRTFDQRLESAINGVSYPAHPPTLIESAEHNGADPDVLDALHQLPDEAFGSFPEVAASVVAARKIASTSSVKPAR